jgi:hypothetical protein
MKSNQPEREEQLKDENAFLKMKLMLEHGAEFRENEKTEIPPEIENIFLQNVAAFEEQYSKQETTTVFEAIGKPAHFKPVSKIPEEEIQDAWEQLRDHLNKHGVDLDSCSPNVSKRELYRFTVEELFDHEIIAMNLTGWCCNFIYDEFHPDPVYESTSAAINDGIKAIFSTEPIEHGYRFADNDLKLNSYQTLTQETLVRIINRFKENFDEIILTGTSGVQCLVDGSTAVVTGKFRVKCVSNEMNIPYKGDWKIDLKVKDNWWKITGIEINGLDFY